jgi:site-specific DNA-cytosine methylase
MKWCVIQPQNGGMALGYENIFNQLPEFILSNNKDRDIHYINYCNTVRNLNIPIIHINQNLSEFESNADKELFDKLNVDIDLVVYLPVCAGLSTLTNSFNSKYINRCSKNIKNQNMYEISEFVLTQIKPKVACFENGRNLYTNIGKDTLNIIKNIAYDNNYSVTAQLVNTFDHGIPQHRKRTFVYFWNTPTSPFLPYEKVDTPTLENYLNQIPSDTSSMNEWSHKENAVLDYAYRYIIDNYEGDDIRQIFKSHFPDKSSLSGIEFIHLKNDWLKAKDWAYSKVSEFPDDPFYNKVLKKYEHCINKMNNNKGIWDNSITIYGGGKYMNAVISRNMYNSIHPTENRSMNLRELMWLMGLPHDYTLFGGRKNWKSITKSVPVNTAMFSAKLCNEFLNNNLSMSNDRFIKQNNINRNIDYSESKPAKLFP